jgi:hypothetical protein
VLSPHAWPACDLLLCTSPGEFAFHKRTAWSADADASTSLPINATSLTQSVCPSKVASGLSSAPPTPHLEMLTSGLSRVKARYNSLFVCINLG